MNELTMKLGERIRHLRKEKGLTQEELGELVDLHANYIGQVERGEKNLTIDTLAKVTIGLGVSLEQLFRFLDPIKTKDELSELFELLDKRSKADKTLALSLIKSVFNWEKQKHS